MCLSVTTLAAASFISTIKLRYEQLRLSVFILNCGFFKNIASFTSWESFQAFAYRDHIYYRLVTPVSFFSDGGGFLSSIKANGTLNAA